MKTARPRLEYFYNLKKGILEQILDKGGDAAADSTEVWSEGWSRSVTLAEYLSAVEKMIEALASLRDFEKEPFTEQEQSDLEAIWQMESALMTSQALA